MNDKPCRHCTADQRAVYTSQHAHWQCPNCSASCIAMPAPGANIWCGFCGHSYSLSERSPLTTREKRDILAIDTATATMWRLVGKPPTPDHISNLSRICWGTVTGGSS